MSTTFEELVEKMTLKEAFEVLRNTNAHGTMDIAKTVILDRFAELEDETDMLAELIKGYQKIIIDLNTKLESTIAENKQLKEGIETVKAEINISVNKIDLQIRKTNMDFGERSGYKTALDIINKHLGEVGDKG